MMDESNVPAAVDEALSERSDGDEPATATEQARRRRRRGGRGRGRGRGTRTPSESSGEDLSVSEEVSRDEEAAEPEQIEAVLAPAEVADGEGDSQAPPKKRRRRGHRGGRGRKRPGARTSEPSTEEATPPAEMSALEDRSESGVEAEAAEKQPAADVVGEEPSADAETTSPGRRRRRGSRTRTRPGTAAAEPSPPATSRPRGRATQLETEELVAAGGATRGIRTTRSRTGRPSSRRREPQTPAPRVTDKLMVVTEHGERDQIAVLESRQLVQHYVTRVGAQSMVGNVYLGRVQNVLPGMEAAFVDVGRGRNGVLYAGEVNFSPEDLDRGSRVPRIEHVLKVGQAIIVQVTKDPMGGKGARLTAQVSLPGRFLVMVPNADVSGISRRLPDNERRRLKGIMRRIKPAGNGIIVRTAAAGASEEALAADLERLQKGWDEIQKRAKKTKAPSVLYEEPELTVRVVRDFFNDEEFEGLVTDSKRVFDRVMEYVSAVGPDLAPKISFHDGPLPVFEQYHVIEQIHKALDRKVWLPSGGYIIIERTEAMSIIDVNTGKSVGKTNLEETVVNTNLEAAREAARQLRLRDIGGIIVIDFIDMLLDQNKRKVEDTMREALALDKSRSQVFEIGPLGLMQVTRKRVSSGLVESFSETCPTCEGRGIIINYKP